MKGAEERRLRRIGNTPLGEATEGNAADDTFLVDQGNPEDGQAGVSCQVLSSFALCSYFAFIRGKPFFFVNSSRKRFGRYHFLFL
jgi:hypothetical protein